jgi:hypothetical protein
MGIGTVGVAFAADSRFCSGEDVPVLRVNHAPGKTIVPGVRDVACSGAFDKRREGGFGRDSFLNTKSKLRRSDMLWTIFVVLLILWLLGFSLHVAGGLIHLLLVVALVVLVINLVSGRRVA